MRYGGLFCNRWRQRYLSQACVALNQSEPHDSDTTLTYPVWAERQMHYRDKNPLICPRCEQPLTFIGTLFGNCSELQYLFDTPRKDPNIPIPLLRPAWWCGILLIPPLAGCQCTFCRHLWRIPRRRILRFEKSFRIKKGQPFVWQCHDCHDGVVIPAIYKNIHGEIVKIDLKTLDPDPEVIRFWPLFHCSTIPSFHGGGTNRNCH